MDTAGYAAPQDVGVPGSAQEYAAPQEMGAPGYNTSVQEMTVQDHVKETGNEV